MTLGHCWIKCLKRAVHKKMIPPLIFSLYWVTSSWVLSFCSPTSQGFSKGAGFWFRTYFLVLCPTSPEDCTTFASRATITNIEITGTDNYSADGKTGGGHPHLGSSWLTANRHRPAWLSHYPCHLKGVCGHIVSSHLAVPVSIFSTPCSLTKQHDKMQPPPA